MQLAKLCLAAACLLAMATSRLAAQGFDGVIQFVSYEGPGDRPDTMTQISKGNKLRFEGMGRDGGAMIMNGSSRIILMTKEKKWMEMPLNFGGKEAAEEAGKHQGTATPTGRTETIAGITCEDWHFKGARENGTPEEGEACIAKHAGMQVNRLSGGMAGRYFTAGGKAFADAMSGGAGVMKVTTNGKVTFIAVKVQATSVPDAMFLPPPDYTKMDMSGMGRPRKP